MSKFNDLMEQISKMNEYLNFFSLKLIKKFNKKKFRVKKMNFL